MKKSCLLEVRKVKKVIFKNIIRIITIIAFFTSITGCTKKTKGSEEKQKINVYIDLNDKDSLEIIRVILDEFKKENNDKELVLNNLLVDNKLEEDLLNGKIDLLITSRNKMLSFSKKGLIMDLISVHSNNKLDERYYNIISSYGRVGDKYFGLGIIPNSIELVYNPEALKKLNMEVPKDIKEALEIVKKLNTAGRSVPVKLPEEIDIKQLPAAFIFSNVVDMENIPEVFDSNKEGYAKLQLQPAFDLLNKYTREGYVNDDTFEVATDSTIDRLINGDIPLIIADSSISKKIKDSKLEVVKEYNVSDKKIKSPAICRALMCIPATTKNEETVNDIIEFIYQDKMQEKLADMGYVTSNKEVDKKKFPTAPNKYISEHLEEASADSIFYLNNFPKEFKPNLESAVINILEGQYTGKEWEEIINKSAK